MKTIVFHSVKGGVGRTLALCNVARALAMISKRVLMLDFDYSAPGLHHKFGKPPAPGYIEYLEEFDVKARTGGVAEGERWRSLERSIEAIDDNLHLLRAGDERSFDYWRYISSYPFHRLFYTARKEISTLNSVAFPLECLKLNIQAFKSDKQLLEDHFCPDYLLVDGKTTMATSEFFLLDWPDAVIHFLPPNTEGIQNACATAAALVRYMSNEKEGHRQIGFVPVISRVPSHMGLESREKFVQRTTEVWCQTQWKCEQRNCAIHLFQPDDFVFLSEMSHMEAKERILFEREDSKRDHLWQLSHDYLSLCARSAPQLATQDWSENEIWWYKRLGMDPNARILAKQFDRYPHLGTMLNIDEQPNIAMRVKTFHLLVGGILESALPDDSEAQQAALRRAGRRCGEDFTLELNETFDQAEHSLDFRQRVKSWAEFDSGVGFGDVHIMEVQAGSAEGWLAVVGDAFAEHKELFSDDEIHDLRGFFVGYMEGVLTALYRATDIDARTIQVRTVTESDLPESAKRPVAEKESQVISYYEFFRKDFDQK